MGTNRRIIGKPLFRKKVSSAHKELSDIEWSLSRIHTLRAERIAAAEQEIKYGTEWRGRHAIAISNAVHKRDARTLNVQKGTAVSKINAASKKRKSGVRGFVRMALAGPKARARLESMKKKGVL